LIASGFDVLQGLVLAVDTKDRYTKRHSDDVARYAVFLAERLELEPEFIRTIHTAGLLHDVGKIGVPDSILRKPGKLTSDEFDVVKQHVALGDMIVRDLADIDMVRAGIRHHHERWDGDGYLDRLAGEAIPLIARIVCCTDAFSAMTSNRPYRRAMSTTDALAELRRCAGTQFDPKVVDALVALVG
jgi:HD-GYP domain-containing protein (c-di-GMP phosphodiesterase class II)